MIIHDKIIVAHTVNMFKAKQKKVDLVISLLNNNRLQQNQYSKSMTFLIFRFGCITAVLNQM